MKYKTSGILAMSDDVLFKFWSLNDLNPKKLWFPNERIFGSNFNLNKWVWTQNPLDNLPVNNLIQLINNVSLNKVYNKSSGILEYPGNTNVDSNYLF